MLAEIPFFRGLIDVSVSTFTDGTYAKWDDTAKRLVGASPITTGLANLEALTSLGIIVQTATDTWAARSLVGTTNRTTVTNGDGIAGNPSIDIAATYVGQASITTLGTITTGTWQGTVIGAAYGGTGLTATPANGQLPIGNGAGYTLAGLTGTANQVTVATGAGSITLSLPQAIASTSTPTFAQLTITNAPSASGDAATKGYVDSVCQGLDCKFSVRVATTANITLSGTQTIDGVALSVGDRVLVKNQSTASANGIYVVASGAWSRAADADTSAEVTSGLFTFVSEGTVNASTGWVLTTPDPITLGTTALTFTQFSGAGQIVDGAGLSKSGNTLSVNVDDASIEINSDTLRVKSTWVGQASLTTLGAITTGVWQGTVIASAYGGTGVATASANSVFAGPTSGGSTAPAFRALVANDIPSLDTSKITTGTLGIARGGTGLTTIPSNGQVYIGNGTGLTLATLTAGAGTSITNGAGSITIANTLPVDNGLCEGRLTLSSGVPVTTNDVTGATTIYFTPFRGNRIALKVVGVWTIYSFTQLTWSSSFSSAAPTDVFISWDGSQLVLNTVVWTNDTTRATALAYEDGVLVRSGSVGERYLGTFRGVSIAIEDSRQNRNIWNYYNRVDRDVYVEDASAAFSYTTAAWREFRNVSTQRVQYVVGVVEDAPQFHVWAGLRGTGINRVAFGFNSTSSPTSPATGFIGDGGGSARLQYVSNGTSARRGTEVVAGFNYVTCLQYTDTGTGDYEKMRLSGNIQG